MEENKLTNIILESAKTAFASRCSIISDRVDKEDDATLNDDLYSVYSFSKFKKIKIINDNIKLFFNPSKFLLCFNKDYIGELDEPRSAVAITSQESSFLIDLTNRNIIIYEEDDTCVIKVVDVDDNIIQTILYRGEKCKAYPYISYTIKNDIDDNVVVDFKMNTSIGDLDKTPICTISSSLLEFPEVFKRNYSLVMDNIDEIANIYTMKSDEKLLYITDGGIAQITNMNGYIIFNILDVTKVNVKWRTSKMKLLDLLKKDHVVIDIPDYIYYNGLLFNKDFEIIDVTFAEYDKLESLKNITMDTQEILSTISEQDYSNLEIVKANKKIITSLYEDCKCSKYCGSNILLSFNGKIMKSTDIYNFVDQLYVSINNVMSAIANIEE